MYLVLLMKRHWLISDCCTIVDVNPTADSRTNSQTYCTGALQSWNRKSGSAERNALPSRDLRTRRRRNASSRSPSSSSAFYNWCACCKSANYFHQQGDGFWVVHPPPHSASAGMLSSIKVGFRHLCAAYYLFSYSHLRAGDCRYPRSQSPKSVRALNRSSWKAWCVTRRSYRESSKNVTRHTNWKLHWRSSEHSLTFHHCEFSMRSTFFVSGVKHLLLKIVIIIIITLQKCILSPFFPCHRYFVWMDINGHRYVCGVPVVRYLYHNALGSLSLRSMSSLSIWRLVRQIVLILIKE